MDYKKITSATTGDEKKRSVGLMDKLKLNELEYKTPLYSAPISLRNQRRFPFAQSSYTAGQSMLCTLQTASFYLDPFNSYLVFDVEFSGATGEKFALGQGSALNFIRSSVVTSRSGTEVSRVDGVNLYHAKKLRFTKPKDWFETEATVIGYDDSPDSKNVVNGYNVEIPAGATVSGLSRFCIPLSMVSPVFDPENSRYLPPFLCSGLRLEIGLSSAGQALHRITGDTTSGSYRIVNPAIMCDLVKMSDKIDSVMTSVAHKAGLELVFSEWDTFTTVTSSQKNTIDINKTASKAEKVIVCSRLSANVSDIKVDSMQSEDFTYNEFQARVGSVYHPQTAITEHKEGYKNALLLFKSMRKNEKDYPSANVNKYTAHNNTHGGFAVLGTNLSRSSLIDSQCVPLNNSHSLSLNIGFTTADSRQVDCFLVYKKIAKIYTNNCIIYE